MDWILSGHQLWSVQRCFVTAQTDFAHHHFDPGKANLGNTCLITFSSGLFRSVLETFPYEDIGWPYSTTPLYSGSTSSGKRFAVHFPSYGGSRTANSLEQLAACGIEFVIGLGLGGTPQSTVNIGDVVLLNGAIRGDGVSRYYAPVEFPAIADWTLTSKLYARLVEQGENPRVGLSFGTDALYRESETLVSQLAALDVLLVDLESSAFLTVGRRLGLKCSWLGVISDRLVASGHEGNIHSEHVMTKLLGLNRYILQTIETL